MPAATAAMGRRWGLLLAAAALAVASCCCQASAFVLPSARPARPPAAAAAAAAATTAPAVVVASRARPAAAAVGPLRSSTDTAPPVPSTSQEVAKDLRTIQEYLNGKHGELLEKFVTTFTPTGEDMRKKNFWRGCVLAFISDGLGCTYVGSWDSGLQCLFVLAMRLNIYINTYYPHPTHTHTHTHAGTPSPSPRWRWSRWTWSACGCA